MALQELFVDRGLLEARLAEAFRSCMKIREAADYASQFSENTATTATEIARNLLNTAEQILASK